MTPKGGEPGIWLPLTLNKQLLWFTRLYRGAEGGTPTGKSPRRQKHGRRMDEEVGEPENRELKEDETGEVESWDVEGEADKLDGETVKMQL